MTIGYVTIAEADAYIAARYSSSDELLIGWQLLNDADKSVYLLRSVEALDGLPYRGKKTLETQLLAFPRYPDAVVPQAVKSAQIENALKLSDPSSEADAAIYTKMKMYGVKSYSIGNLSETLGSGGGIGSGNTDIPSDKALRLLQPFLSGGYRIE